MDKVIEVLQKLDSALLFTSSTDYRNMPAPFNPTGSDLNATHQAQALLEASMRLQAVELAIPEDSRPNNVSVTFDSDAQEVSITATLPTAITLDANGHRVSAPTEYTASPFTPGTSDLKSDTLPEAVCEIATLLRQSELAVAEEIRPNNISVTDDGQNISISATLPSTIALNASGETVTVATDYIP